MIVVSRVLPMANFWDVLTSIAYDTLGSLGPALRDSAVVALYLWPFAIFACILVRLIVSLVSFIKSRIKRKK